MFEEELKAITGIWILHTSVICDSGASMPFKCIGSYTPR